MDIQLTMFYSSKCSSTKKQHALKTAGMILLRWIGASVRRLQKLQLTTQWWGTSWVGLGMCAKKTNKCTS